VIVIIILQCVCNGHVSVMCRNLNTVRAISKEHEHPVDRFTVMAKWYVTGVFISEYLDLDNISAVMVS